MRRRQSVGSKSLWSAKRGLKLASLGKKFFRDVSQNSFRFFNHGLHQIVDLGHVVYPLGGFAGGQKRFFLVTIIHSLDGLKFILNQGHIDGSEIIRLPQKNAGDGRGRC